MAPHADRHAETSHAYEDIKRGYDPGANSFLVKPTGFHELKKLVADILSYGLSHNRTLPLERN